MKQDDSGATHRPRVGRLRKLTDLRREWMKVYRDARLGRIDISTASRLSYMLQIGASIMQADAIEEVERLIEEEERRRAPYH